MKNQRKVQAIKKAKVQSKQRRVNKRKVNLEMEGKTMIKEIR